MKRQSKMKSCCSEAGIWLWSSVASLGNSGATDCILKSGAILSENVFLFLYLFRKCIPFLVFIQKMYSFSWKYSEMYSFSSIYVWILSVIASAFNLQSKTLWLWAGGRFRGKGMGTALSSRLGTRSAEKFKLWKPISHTSYRAVNAMWSCHFCF